MCKLWECRNVYCPNYVGNGVRLGITEIELDPLGFHGCRRCGVLVREMGSLDSPLSKTLTSVALGALIGGWASWSLMGTSMGGVAGLLLCLLVGLRDT